MYWLRSALLYLFVTVLLCAGIWLFWGDAIGKYLKDNSRNAGTEQVGRQTGAVKEKTPTAKKLQSGKDRVKAEQAAVSSREAWEKASAAFLLLLQTAAEENRRLLLDSVAEQDRRYRNLLSKSVEQRPSTPRAK